MTTGTALQSMSAADDALAAGARAGDTLDSSQFGLGIIDILEERRTKLQQHVLGKDVAKKHQLNIIEPAECSASIDNFSILQDRINEIRELTSNLPANATLEQNREILYCIYTRAAEAIGRNSVEAIKADAVARLQKIVDLKMIPEYSQSKESSPQDWVAKYVVGKLDRDMLDFAYDMDIYRKPMEKFYNTVKVWRSRSADRVAKFITRRG